MISELLKKSLPLYELTLPVSGKKCKYRPMTVKEEKILLLAQKSDSGAEMARALLQIIESCFEGIESPEKMAIADVEKAFLSLRAKSIGEEAVFSIICPETNEVVTVKVDLEKFELNTPKVESNKIKLSENMILVLKEPEFSYLLNEETDSDDDMKSIFKNCFVEVQTPENVYYKKEVSEQDMSNFYDLMTGKSIEQLKQFLNATPRMKKTLEYKTKDQTNRSIDIMGIESFFAYASAT